MNVLVTGAAGFIGAAVVKKFLESGHQVVGVDNLNDYYDVRLKQHRLENIQSEAFIFLHMDIENKVAVQKLFKDHKIECVVNLAARAGVRYSIENPQVYFETNVLGALNILEEMKSQGITNFIQASTSSLYAGQAMPFVETLKIDKPLSPYAASKQAAESLAYTYHHLYGIDVKVLRFFTVYGPAGRPDMSILRFIKFTDEGLPLNVFGDGSQSRDFTYIDDIAEGTYLASQKELGFEVINLGGGDKCYELNFVIKEIERGIKKVPKVNNLAFHLADMRHTSANIDKAKELLNWVPETALPEGIDKTIHWYLKNRELCRSLKF